MAATNNTEFILTAKDLASNVIGKVGSALGGLAAPAQAANAALGSLAGGAALLGLGAVAKQAIDAADNLNDLSQKTGVAIKDLAAYKLAAEQSGTSLEGVAKGIKTLSTNLVENGAALGKVGIDTKDANVAIRQLADVFKDLPDGVEKSALATKLFGKAGVELIPLLNQGSKGLDKSAKAAERYAEIMERLAPQADQFNDNLAELSLTSQALGAQLAASIVPELNKITTAMALAAQEGGALKALFVGFGGVAESAVSPFAAAFKGLKAELLLVGAELDELRAKITFGQVRENAIKSALGNRRDAQQTLAELSQRATRDKIKPPEIDKAAAEKAQKEALATGKKIATALGLGVKEGSKKAKEDVDELGNLLQKVFSKQTGFDADYQKNIGLLSAGFASGRVSAGEFAEALFAINQQQPIFKKASEDAAKAQQDWADAVEKANAAARESVATQVDRAFAAKEELENYGKTRSQIEETTIARLEEQVRLTAGLDSQEKLVASLEKEIAARKENAGYLRGIEAKDAAKKAAEDSAKAWEKFSDDIERSLTDALMRSFESGNGFGKTFVETLKNTLKTAALKIVVQAIVDPVTGGLKGGLTGGQGGAGGSISNLLNFSQTPALDTFQRLANSNIGGSIFTTESPMGGRVLTEFGSTVSSFAEAVDTYGGYVNAIYQLTEGNYGQAIGTAVGQYVGGPIGAAIGNEIGKLLDQAFGGGGGPKVDGRYIEDDGAPVFNQSGPYNDLAKTFVTAIDSTVTGIFRRYGVADNVSSSGSLSTDPEGTAQTQLDARIISNGRVLYSRFDQYGGNIENAGRSKEELTAAIADTTRDAILTAVARSDIGGPAVVALFDQFEAGLVNLSAERADALVAALAGGWLEEVISSGASLEEVADIAKRIAALAPEIVALRSAVETLPFENLKNLSINATESLLILTGGIQKLAPAIDTYYQEFYTAEEKRALALDAANKVVAESFAAIETSVPATRAEFRDLIESLDLTTESGRKTYATLLKAAPAFDAVADAADQSLRDLAQEWTGFDAAGLGRLILDSAFNREAGESAAAEFAKALEESVRNALIGSVVGNIAESIYEAIVLPMVAGAAVSKETIAEVTKTAQAAINSLGEVLDTLDLSAIIGAVPDLSQLIAPKPATSSGSTSSGLDAIEDAQRAIADERANLERQLLQLQGDTVELRRREREALDESNRAIYDQIKALEDQKDAEKAAAEAAEKAAQEAAQAAAKRLADSRSQLDILSQIAGLTGDETLAESVKASQRALRLIELSSEGASQEMIDLVRWLFAAEDAAAAARKSLEAANKSLEGMKRIADELKQVADFREGIGGSQQGIRSQMAGFDAVAFQAAQKAAAQAALDSLGDDATTTQRISAGKKLQDAILGSYDAQLAAINKNRDAAEAAARSVFEAEENARRKAIESANQLNAAYRSVGEYAQSLLLSAQSPLSGRTRLAAAGSDFASLAARARTGDLDALGKLQGSSSAYLDEARTMAVSSADYGRVFGRVVGELTQIGGLAGQDMEYTTRQFYVDSTAYDEQIATLQTSTLSQLEDLAELTDDWTTALQEQMTEDALVFAEIGLSTEQTATLLQGLGPGFESVVTAVNAATAAQAETAAMLATMQAMQAEIAALRQSQAVATAQARRTADAVNGNPEAPMLVETTT